MILESTAPRPPFIITPNPKRRDLIEYLAILLLFLDDLLTWSRPRWMRLQITALVRYDKARRDLGGYRWLWPVARTFVLFWCAFLLIEIIAGRIT